MESPDNLYNLEECETGESYAAMAGDELLKDFLQWEPRYWGSFFSKTGDFDGGQVSQRMFITWQRVIEYALATPQSEWRSGLRALGIVPTVIERLLMPIPITFHFDGPDRVGEIYCITVLDEIIASVHVAKMNEGEFRRCGNFKCNNSPFAIGPHNKQFCGPKCAHTVGERARRKAAKEEALRPSTKRNGQTRKAVSKKGDAKDGTGDSTRPRRSSSGDA